MIICSPIGHSCPILSCPVLCCPVLSYAVLSCPMLSCPVLCCPVLWSKHVNVSIQTSSLTWHFTSQTWSEIKCKSEDDCQGWGPRWVKGSDQKYLLKIPVFKLSPLLFLGGGVGEEKLTCRRQINYWNMITCANKMHMNTISNLKQTNI